MLRLRLRSGQGTSIGQFFPTVSQQFYSSSSSREVHSLVLRRSFPLRRSGKFQSKDYSTASSETSQIPHPKNPSLLRRFLGISSIAIFSFLAGYLYYPAQTSISIMTTPIPSDEETLNLFSPPDEISSDINSFIDTHPLSLSLRENRAFTESRPHLKIPAELRGRNLTAGTLAGTDKIVVPPYTWSEKGGKSFVSIFYLGAAVSGHPGIVHGGLLATLLDEGMARCCFPALPNGIGVTANLNLDYRRPAPAGSFAVLRAETVRVEGRKAWVEGRIETLPEEGVEPTVLVEAKALFVEPKHAASMPRLFKATSA